jgi:alkylation response protein AidB-like acyl-CoA dehydrogenase
MRRDRAAKKRAGSGGFDGLAPVPGTIGDPAGEDPDVNDSELELVTAVRALAREKFAARAATHDREGSFVADNVEELRALGIAGMILPRDVGGLGMGCEAMVRVMEEIAWADASTAVALNMHLLIAHFISFMPPFPHQRRVLEEIARGAFVCGPGSIPSGQLDNRRSGFQVREDGDALIFDGVGGFASMSEAATFLIMGGWIEGKDGEEPRVALTFPRLDAPGVKNLRNWNAMGMRGTASHDVRAEGLRVPKSEALVLPLSLMREGQERITVELARRRSWGALGILGIWVGLSQAAFDHTLAYVQKRHGYLSGTSALATNVGFRADEAWAQSAIGAMDHWLGTGRILLYDTVARLDGRFDDLQALTRHLVRTVYHLRRMSEEVAQGAMKTCGAHAYVAGHPLERVFRDLVGANVMAWKTDQLEHLLGLAALGRPITLVGPAGT